MFTKIGLMTTVAVGALLSAHSVMADALVVKGDLLYFTSANKLTINLIAGGTLPASCPSNTQLPISLDVSGATADSDVVVSGNSAFVKIAVDGGSVISVPIIPACLADDSQHSVGECISEADLGKGLLTIPCVHYEGKVYEVHLNQRGNSSNWEVSSALLNNGFINFPGLKK